jgi:hypothetical protein
MSIVASASANSDTVENRSAGDSTQGARTLTETLALAPAA